MKAMVLRRLCDLGECDTPLEALLLPDPIPGPAQVLIRVSACGVCHTELDEIEGRTPPPRLPVILGHQVVGRVERLGPGAERLRVGERVGVGWLFSTCGACAYCRSGRENLCAEFRATGRDADGGYAELIVAPESSAFAIPDVFSDVEAAPLLCAGSVGYRALRLAAPGGIECLGLTGFGASGHLVLTAARHLHPRLRICVFARSPAERDFALGLGADWAGDTGDEPPWKCDAIIDTTPAWRPAVEALRNLAPGGRLVINAIRKEDADKERLLEIDYPVHLWMEKQVRSVANVTRKDCIEFLRLAGEMRLRPETQTYALDAAGRALWELKRGRIRGAKVLMLGE